TWATIFTSPIVGAARGLFIRDWKAPPALAGRVVLEAYLASTRATVPAVAVGLLVMVMIGFTNMVAPLASPLRNVNAFCCGAAERLFQGKLVSPPPVMCRWSGPVIFARLLPNPLSLSLSKAARHLTP
ncbi:MAG: hypothetical protein ACKOPO_04395, partial [Novosphingobium sp.]